MDDRKRVRTKEELARSLKIAKLKSELEKCFESSAPFDNEDEQKE